ncbi:hypothetical protein [Archangium primigenium]|uniref:hypothetical protein n=1 Tax=[Archangium] primigenium TaxID=2792470 RepID=UPI00195D9A1B|nr:hypothetical protein [Archangium primigenium]MBM7117624.1 hypothetical protein [Archangium primigenium]
MSKQSKPAALTSPTTPAYVPPPELVAAAEASLGGASEHERSDSARAYMAYGRATAHRSAVTGNELPGFTLCPTLVRAGWLEVVRELRPDAEVERARAGLVAVANSMNQEIAEAQQKLDDLNQEIATLSQQRDDMRGVVVRGINVREGKPLFDEVVVSLAIATGSEAMADQHGIVVVGHREEADGLPHTYLLQDLSLQAPDPSAWAKVAVDAVHRWAHCAPPQKAYVLAEENTGGAMVANIIHAVDPSVTVKTARILATSELASSVDDSEECHIDPFLMGISQISAAAKDLAKAQQDGQGEVAALVTTTAKALHERVKALALPASER